MPGLPDGTRRCPFRPGGVLTDTVNVHTAARKQVFDNYLMFLPELLEEQP